MRARRVIEAALGEGRKVLNEHESKLVLAEYGIPVTRERVVRTREEALRAAGEIGYPVVLKICSHEVTHKQDFGGVHVGIESDKQLLAAYEAVFERARAQNIEPLFLVQEMVEGGVETLVGSKKDEIFGPTILFGLGGIFTEVLEDFSLRICPIERRDAEEMIREIKGYKILRGYRNMPPADVEALTDALLKVSKLVTEHPEIKELDINPLFVRERGRGVVAADSLIVLDG
ncbi:MAG: acetate--CoA ligase family protein [Candidatus Alkanophagales archaeon]